MTRRLALDDDNRRWWTLAAMCFALFMIMLDNTVVNVALPSIKADLGSSYSTLAWTVSAYTLSLGVLLITGGRLGDIYGRRTVFLFGVVLFAASSLFIAFSQTSAWLIAGRASQGIGAALMMPATLSIITNTFPPQERGKALGTWAGVSALALAIGPVVGGYLVEYVSWQSIFFLNVPVAAGALAITLFSTCESRDETIVPKLDLAGIATISVGLGALTLALLEAPSWGWGSPANVGLFGVAVLGLTTFALVERRVRVPMVDFSFFASRTFLGASLVAFIVSFAMLAMFFFMAIYLQTIEHYTPLQAGIRFLPTTLMIIVISPLSGRLSDRIGPRPLLTGGLVLVAISLFWQSHLSVGSGFAFLAPGFVLMGVGMGLIMSPMSAAAMNAVDRTKAGVAGGILSMSRMVGGTLGIAVLGALVGNPRAPEAYVDSLGHGLRIGASVAALGAVVAWTLIAPQPGRAESPAVPAGEAVAPPAEAAREPVGA
ncbi:MAG TPA: MFS transporter [Solirubrobacteraceae bacterium]|jgi:EmrB/QacA subfamily drug resistance transporter|nr:MFS transporter [Solirubrobacteraceae bacterium]